MILALVFIVTLEILIFAILDFLRFDTAAIALSLQTFTIIILNFRLSQRTSFRQTLMSLLLSVVIWALAAFIVLPTISQASLQLPYPSCIGQQFGYWQRHVNGYKGSTVYTAVSAGTTHSLALREDGTVIAWGSNRYGQTDVPQDLSDVIAISAGRNHSLALRQDGNVIGWGSNQEGQLDIPEGLTDVVAISAGGSFSMALDANGRMTLWGMHSIRAYAKDNPEDYELGEFFASDDVTYVEGISMIAAGAHYALALQQNGELKAWGRKYDEQFHVPQGNDFVDIAAGTVDGFAQRADGSIVSWGQNLYDQADIPTNLQNIVDIAAGFQYAMVLQADGRIKAWGQGLNGECCVPWRIKDFTMMDAGMSHVVALRQDGSIVSWGSDAWGSDGRGQLYRP